MKSLALAAFVTLAGAAAPEPGPAPHKPARFLALGDSYTIGEGLVPAQRWPVQLAALLRQKGVATDEPQIIARTGWTVPDLAGAVTEARPQGPFDLVTLQIGVNDQYQGVDPVRYRPTFAALLKRAIALAGGSPKRVVVLSIPDWSVTPFAGETGRDRTRTAAEIEQFNRVDREETARAGARWVDVTPSSRKAAADRSLLAPDGLHPAGGMYGEWAKLALPETLAALGVPPPGPGSS
ncbi:MAG TPA: SGNH/GDSL hydrolase family protein [Thermoanaerobaculia bacterium]|jgi:lysophospholipase L1-like esterase|nr:SGNH/GDSL hydrolase family protein [Thermoanaerobaculia bacterium]